MAWTVPRCGRSWLVCSWLFAAALGCGSGKSGNTKTSAALHIISAPVHASQVGNQMTYQAVLSQPGAADWTMDQGPHGATVDEGGNVTWTPGKDQGGDQAFTVSAKMDGHTVTQTFTVTAASSVTETSAHVDPDDPNGATVTVDAPLSSVQGAAVQMPPGSLPPGDPVAVSISSMQHPPVPPAAQVAGVTPSDVRPVELGPSGLTFRKPARLQLPISAGLMKMPNLAVQTYDYRTGQWKRVKTVSVDKTAHVVVAEIEHFSTYVVVPDVPVFDLKLALGGTACAGALVVRAPLVVGFGDVPGAGVNGYTGTGATVADVLAGMKEGEALQVYTRVSARAAVPAGEQTGWLLAAASKQGDGTFKVSVTSDGHASPFLKVPAAGLKATDPELLSWMNGSRADFVFGALGDLSAGAVASAEASLYLVPASDADHAPPASANAVGTADLEVATLAALADDVADGDCDGAPDAWDPAPAGATPPALVGYPGSPVHVAVGSAAPFKISSPQDGVTFTWAASDPSVTVLSAMGGAMVTPMIPGFFHLVATGTRAGATATYSWDVIADPAAVVAANTAPFVSIGAGANVVRAGEAVKLTAFGKDAQQATLAYAWSATDATTLSGTSGDTVVFSATAPGDYVVTCVASDGSAASAPATLTITVLSATANRPPGMPSVSPLSVALTHDKGAPVSLTLTAKADDPDGDALTYDFAPDAATPPTFTLTKSGASAAFSSSQDGAYVFYVTATDPQGARGPWAVVKILVLPPLAAQPVDADKDGYPAGFDCDDNNPTVHPGAKEICADGKDQDCDGRDTPAAECDADGDRFSIMQGDCDDTNPAISPLVVERCDGIDNNCNGVKDEGFGVGVDCSNGVGACQVKSTTVCSKSFVDVVCGGTVGAPQPEVCDGVDNDCNGRVDDVAGNATGDVANCGGCGIACAAGANSVAACVMGGCVSACAVGFVDADRVADNGCECKLTNGGVEICDGVDNDCNGAVDDGVGAVNYPGPAGTAGVGVCAAGVQVCRAGTLMQMLPPRLPSMELCDGLDNDCNGKVDDGFDFLNDDRNCGACGLVCASGTHCMQGKCPLLGADGGAPNGDGGVIMTGDGGFMPPSNLGACPNATGGTSCTDLSNDHANCGTCGHACATAQYCGGGVCTDFPPANCGTGQTACLDPNGQKPFCTDLLYDSRNCNACGNVCPNGPCMNGVCQSPTGTDGGTSTSIDGGATNNQCPPMAQNLCPGPAGSTYCADFLRGLGDCGGCGHACAAGLVCNNGVCMDPQPTGGGTCGNGLVMCPTGCTSFQDDARNCGGCGLICDGTCSAGQCLLTPGQSPQGSMCTSNASCAGGLCMDMPRFGWPMGYCTSICDAGLPCPQGQKCVGSPTSGAFGSCRLACATSADCFRAGFICAQGTCQPDCRSNPMVCSSTGQTCDPATGGCLAQSVPVCTQPQITCGGGGGSYCADLSREQGNCGGCSRFCPANTMCNGGVCSAPTCGAPGTACVGPGGGTFCTDLLHDAANCGACGKVCASNAICTNGVCQGGGGSYPGLAACTGPGGAPFCTNLLGDPGNCGACGNRCAAAESCFSGTCGTAPPPPVCPPDNNLCKDASGQKQYCSNPLYDPGNCGGCGNVCAAGSGCNNGVCMAATTTDGGAIQQCPAPGRMCATTQGTYCAMVQTDPSNCGGCGNVCPANSFCMNAICMPNSGDGGAQPKCIGSQITCFPAAAPAYCTDVTQDPANCGACFKPCPGGWACQASVCVQAASQDGGAT
jgi:hypothetical protein